MPHWETQPAGKIAVLGLGKEGLDLLRFLNKLKVKPAGLDAKVLSADDPHSREIRRWTSELRLGEDYLDQLTDFDLVFRSPGVPLNLPAIRKAKRRGTVFSSLTQLFFDLSPAKIVGVTGTKGKSTTTALIHHLIKGQVKGRVYFGGNIGYPPLMLLTKLTKQDVAVLELSSFQLEDLTKSPQIAVMLNIVPEHLNRHKTFAKYLDAKLNLIRYQTKNDYVVMGADHPITAAVAKLAPGKLVKYSTRKILPRGLYVAKGELIYRDIKTGQRTVIMEVAAVPLLGRHNLENALAAVTVALLLGVKPARIRQRVQTFTPLEHRLEPAGKVGQVKFINDSLATTPVATIAAINTLTSPLVLILGGSSKKENFAELIALLLNWPIQGAVLIGDTADRLFKLLKTARVKFPFIKTKDFPTAVRAAYQYAQPAGTVLFSPACASFGWFADAYDRGKQFKQLVKQLAK